MPDTDMASVDCHTCVHTVRFPLDRWRDWHWTVGWPSGRRAAHTAALRLATALRRVDRRAARKRRLAARRGRG